MAEPIEILLRRHNLCVGPMNHVLHGCYLADTVNDKNGDDLGCHYHYCSSLFKVLTGQSIKPGFNEFYFWHCKQRRL